DCPEGYVQTLSGQTKCFICPAGVSCNKDSTSDDPLTSFCSAGYYSLDGGADCIICPSGYQCKETYLKPRKCQHIREYAPEGSVFCLGCPAGFRCPDPASAPEMCPQGSYSYSGDGVCKPCFPGYVCLSGSKSPAPQGQEALKGTYIPLNNGGNSISCPRGYFGIKFAARGMFDGCDICPA
ncbi:hypothetical protein IE077_000897, partial [Cardiosporidium cionae]